MKYFHTQQSCREKNMRDAEKSREMTFPFLLFAFVFLPPLIYSVPITTVFFPKKKCITTLKILFIAADVVLLRCPNRKKGIACDRFFINKYTERWEN